MDYVPLIQMVGIPIGFFVGLLWLMWRTGMYLMLHVIKPWTDRHLNFVDRMQQATTEHTIILAAMLKAQEQHVKVLTQMIVTLRAIQVSITPIPPLEEKPQ